jgi:hypothetical protein
MQKTIEMDLMVLVMVFLKKFICRCVDDSGLRSITSALNWLFGIHNSKKFLSQTSCLCAKAYRVSEQ